MSSENVPKPTSQAKSAFENQNMCNKTLCIDIQPDKVTKAHDLC